MPSVEVTAGHLAVKIDANEASAKELAELAAVLVAQAAAHARPPGVISVGAAAGGGHTAPMPGPINPGDGSGARDLATGTVY